MEGGREMKCGRKHHMPGCGKTREGGREGGREHAHSDPGTKEIEREMLIPFTHPIHVCSNNNSSSSSSSNNSNSSKVNHPSRSRR